MDDLFFLPHFTKESARTHVPGPRRIGPGYWNATAARAYASSRAMANVAASRTSAAAAVAILLVSLLAPAPLRPQTERTAAANEETVASLAAGRVVIAVVKGAILIGTVENPVEADTHPPIPVPIASERVGVILGAVRWSSPSSQREIARLDEDLPHLHSTAVMQTPHLAVNPVAAEASDLEVVGRGFLDRLSELAEDLHAKVDLPKNEPLAELIVADYFAGYGPEVWQLAYPMKQQEETPGYFTTRVLLPSYIQIWPPEKGQPHTLMEFAYPPESAPPTLLDLLRRNDPKLQGLIASDPKMAAVAQQLVAGESRKIPAGDATQFLRAALDAIAPPGTRETMAMIGEEDGFSWVLPPPQEKARPDLAPPRSPDAPSLLHPTQ